MVTRKVAITIPSDVLEMVDGISRKKQISRSSYISGILRERVTDEHTREIKEAYDRVFADDAVKDEQES